MGITFEYLNKKLPFDVAEMIAKKVYRNRKKIIQKKRTIFLIWYNNTYFNHKIKFYDKNDIIYCNNKIYNTNKLLRELDNYGLI